MERLSNIGVPNPDPDNPPCPYVVPTENWIGFARPDQLGLILALPPQPYLSADWALCLIWDGPPVGYISPLAFFDFAPGDTREVLYYLVPGDMAEGRKIVYDLVPHTTWNFDLDTPEGWRAGGAAPVVTDGIAAVSVSPDAPLVSLPDLDFNGRAAPAVRMLARSDVPLELCLSFRAVHAPGWISDPELCRTVSPGEFASMDFDLSALPDWRTSLIEQLRFETTGTGLLEIDELRVVPQGQVLEFFIADEIETSPEINQLEDIRIDGGVLYMHASGNDPYFDLPFEFPILAEDHPAIEIRMKVTAGAVAEFFFAPEGDGFSGENMLVFDIFPDGEFHTYTLDLAALPSWSGQIHALRLDPTVRAADIEIDYILLP
jgi:hypothetical protein